MYSPGCYNATVPGDATEAAEMAISACLKECSKKNKVYAFLQANFKQQKPVFFLNLLKFFFQF